MSEETREELGTEKEEGVAEAGQFQVTDSEGSRIRSNNRDETRLRERNEIETGDKRPEKTIVTEKSKSVISRRFNLEDLVHQCLALTQFRNREDRSREVLEVSNTINLGSATIARFHHL